MSGVAAQHTPELSIILINFNSSEYLLSCIDSIAATAGEIEKEVIVVDNGSSGEALTLLDTLSVDVLIRNSANVGFAGANNLGMQRATGRYILFLNPDTVVLENTLANMCRFMDEHGSVGAATCFVRLPDGTLDDASHRGFPTPWNALCHFSGLSRLLPRARLLGGYTLGWEDLSRTHDIDALAGCFMVVRREAGDAAGWWDDDYFFYGEDLDFCFRLKENGWRIVFVPSVSILHHKGMSSGIKKVSRRASNADRTTRLLATRARFDAMRIFYRKHYESAYPATVRFLVFAAISLMEQKASREIRSTGNGNRHRKWLEAGSRWIESARRRR